MSRNLVICLSELAFAVLILAFAVFAPVLAALVVVVAVVLLVLGLVGFWLFCCARAGVDVLLALIGKRT